ncbi:MAG TPA: hypothetical protein VJX73_01450 [Terracidiphilus sp.]|nr:hypothetical protein [Terracidiphilus sp.]
MAGDLTRSGRDRARRKTRKRTTFEWQSHPGKFLSERILGLDSTYIRFRPEPVAQTARKPARMKINAVFLRDECILPSQFDLLQEPFCKGWAVSVQARQIQGQASLN